MTPEQAFREGVLFAATHADTLARDRCTDPAAVAALHLLADNMRALAGTLITVQVPDIGHLLHGTVPDDGDPGP